MRSIYLVLHIKQRGRYSIIVIRAYMHSSHHIRNLAHASLERLPPWRIPNIYAPLQPRARRSHSSSKLQIMGPSISTEEVANVELITWKWADVALQRNMRPKSDNEPSLATNSERAMVSNTKRWTALTHHFISSLLSTTRQSFVSQ